MSRVTATSLISGVFNIRQTGWSQGQYRNLTPYKRSRSRLLVRLAAGGRPQVPAPRFGLPPFQCIFVDSHMITKEEIKAWFLNLQSRICSELEEADGKGKFIVDSWERPGGGGGLSRVITDGNIIEKGGVNFSAVWGKTPAQVLSMMKTESSEIPDFFATGVSIVLHPASPMVPIIHMNVRYFEMTSGTWWFGGGIDLTPHYVDQDDARHFHRTLKEVCDKHHPTYYPAFKKWADDYFFLR